MVQMAEGVLGIRSCFLGPGRRGGREEQQTGIAALVFLFVKGIASWELLGIVHSPSPAGAEGLKCQFLMEGGFHQKTHFSYCFPGSLSSLERSTERPLFLHCSVDLGNAMRDFAVVRTSLWVTTRRASIGSHPNGREKNKGCKRVNFHC